MTTSLILTLVAVFGAVALATGGAVFYVLQQTAPERRRLGRVGRPIQTGVLLESAPGLTSAPTNFYKQVTTLLPRSREGDEQAAAADGAGGLPHADAHGGVYTLARLVCPVVFGVAAALLRAGEQGLADLRHCGVVWAGCSRRRGRDGSSPGARRSSRTDCPTRST